MLILSGVGATGVGHADAPQKTAEDVKLVQVRENGTQKLWPYTSRGKAFETLTLPVNVVVMEDAATTRRVLASREGWEAGDPDGDAVVINGTGVTWGETRGATRYTYVHTPEGGEWKTEAAQIHDGTYLGARTHLRLYEGGEGATRWTAIQSHTEHWDWFRLRHTVASTADGRFAVEQDIYGTSFVESVSRQRYANGGTLDADGWVTVFDLVDWQVKPTGVTALVAALTPLLVGATLTGHLSGVRGGVGRLGVSRLSRHHVGLFLATALTLPLVRATSVWLETAYFSGAPKLVAAPMYLVLALGLPLAATLLGKQLSADDGFTVAVAGLGVGTLLDYSLLGVTNLPVGVIVHRVVLVFALGLVAAGGTRWAESPLLRHGYRVPGLAFWVGALIWPLAGV